MTRSKNRIISKLACGVRTSNTALKDSSLSDQSLCLKKIGRSSARNMEENKSAFPLGMPFWLIYAAMSQDSFQSR